PIESDASSTVSSTCQSNDSDGDQGTVSDHSVNDDPIPIPSSEQVSTSIQKTQPQVPKPQQTVDPSCAQHVKTPRQPIRQPIRTPVTPSSIPSYNRQNWNQRMERELGNSKDFSSQCCKRIFKYLKGKPNLGLWYPSESPFDLEAFSDSDYGGSNLDKKSTTGGC
ncbi:hypothetical protein Tco_0176978, partial [Tanacetum coccineum]